MPNLDDETGIVFQLKNNLRSERIRKKKIGGKRAVFADQAVFSCCKKTNVKKFHKKKKNFHKQRQTLVFFLFCCPRYLLLIKNDNSFLLLFSRFLSRFDFLFEQRSQFCNSK